MFLDTSSSAIGSWTKVSSKYVFCIVWSDSVVSDDRIDPLDVKMSFNNSGSAEIDLVCLSLTCPSSVLQIVRVVKLSPRFWKFRSLFAFQILDVTLFLANLYADLFSSVGLLIHFCIFCYVRKLRPWSYLWSIQYHEIYHYKLFRCKFVNTLHNVYCKLIQV